MRRKLVYLAFVGALVVAAGCSKQGMVKKDEGIAPAPAAASDKGVAKVVSDKAKPVAAPVASAPVQAQPVVAENGGGASGKSADAELKEGLQKIYFDFDSYALSKKDRETLQKNMELLKKASAKVQIQGNCDERGSDDYNLALGEKRAQEAKKYLVNLGIPADRLSVISYGKEKPADAGYNDAAWAKNRRDEFVVQ